MRYRRHNLTTKLATLAARASTVAPCISTEKPSLHIDLHLVCYACCAVKGDALHAAEISLSLEKLNFGRLRELHTLADEADDADMTHFLEDYLIDEQSRDVKESAVLVSQLMRAGKGLGVFTIDYALQKKYDVKGANAGLKNFGNDSGDNNGTPLFAVTPLL